MSVFIVIGAGLLAAGLTFVTNWLALKSWRSVKGGHWAEQARLVYPAAVAAQGNLLSIPGIFTLAVLLLWPDSSPLWLFTGLVLVLGAYAGTLFLSHEVFPRIPIRDLVRHALINVLLKFATILIFIGATIFMPREFNWQAWAIGGGVIILRMIWARGGMVWSGRKLGLLAAAPERLRKIATDTSAQMRVPFRDVLLMRSPIAQAYALITTRQMLFTERLLEILPDDELAAVCAHELAHLTESKASRYARSIRMLTFMPWMFFNPLIYNFGGAGFFGLCLTTALVPSLYRKLSRKLEFRADRMATNTESDTGIYARALTRLYEDNLAPAVTAKDRATHPHLYDRILAAGVTPDFARPAPADSMASHGQIFAVIAGVMLAIFVIGNLEKWSAPRRINGGGDSLNVQTAPQTSSSLLPFDIGKS